MHSALTTPTEITASTPRHQCLIYKGSPATHFSGLSAVIRQKLTENYRCLYFNTSAMIAAMRPYLLAAGIDIPQEVERGRLVLSSNPTHLTDGHFSIDRMLGMLEEGLNQALQDGHAGFWCTGDMTLEFGPERDFSKLLDYEWRLETFLQSHPALSGICQYHADTLPNEVLRQGLLAHPSLYINETLSRLNPHYVDRESFTAATYHDPALDKTIRALCMVPDALILNALPPGYLH
ncbi:MAG: MEDS domain-containing protein [Nitrospira sp.]|nr:MEDS domain-containing protein [Nitrospira sp.]MBX7038527.1 MEDS domain-containing protein [Nitrospira sp.]HMV57818.1 MEDS domain-containing protein [Nitrospira sp.]HMW87283.1 MEDS domain-containing protein [Nitrospira sp.]HMX90205.1 MEDS domain-containing protein [Nitrospira sp.]